MHDSVDLGYTSLTGLEVKILKRIFTPAPPQA